MTREDYASRVKDIMINKNPYGYYHQQNFNLYERLYGEMTPINSSIINNMPNAQIIISEEVYASLLAVNSVTNETRQEIPFFLYGKEVSDNVIEFTGFMSSSNNRQNAQAHFDQAMLDNLQNEVNNNMNNNFVVCHGHSHPPIGEFNENFSFGDFISYMEMNQNNEVFRNKKVELTSCLVTPKGDINFAFYDNVSDNFYRFTNVYVKDNYNNYKPVNCYGLNQEKEYNNHINQ